MTEVRTRAHRRTAGGRRGLVIAIDGPSASGKTSVGREVARRLGYAFLDTGNIYRALTWLALQRGIDARDEEGLAALARATEVVLTGPDTGAPEPSTILMDGHDVTPHLRRPEVEAVVSQVSRVPAVRQALLEVQRRLARDGGIVMAGRDIGTVVLPNADLKVYLDASPEERARRRYLEMRQQGRQVSLEQVARELAVRDETDSRREAAPLRPAEDAVIVQTDGLTLAQVVARVMELVEARLA
ncbi:MAG TPA: (d)CMP kinase [Dehalococcoidia bacterium]|nr:(d)CMP kinase [Dehalococcoidia bacterium]